jgi:hypothetical protein
MPHSRSGFKSLMPYTSTKAGHQVLEPCISLHPVSRLQSAGRLQSHRPAG